MLQLMWVFRFSVLCTVFGTTKRETSGTPVFPNQFGTVLFLFYSYSISMLQSRMLESRSGRC